MRKPQEDRSGFAVTFLLGLVALLFTASSLAAQADEEVDLDIRVPQNKYCLTVEPLVDDVADVDVRRFTVFSRSPRKVDFRYGQAGFLQQPMERVPGSRNLYFFESILITRIASNRSRG